MITETAINETNKKRCVLIICETIIDVNLISSSILNKSVSKNKIIVYTNSEDKNEEEQLKNYPKSELIIIATNLAGRGTDIKTTD